MAEPGEVLQRIAQVGMRPRRIRFDLQRAAVARYGVVDLPERA